MKKYCKNGHVYIKKSDCLICPKCENQKKAKVAFISLLSMPAKRALGNAKIDTLKKLSKFSEKELLKLHGLGPSTIPVLKEYLTSAGLAFSNDTEVKNNAVEVYISKYPKHIQAILKKISLLILNTNKEINESISYGMPAYKFNKKPVMYFAAYEHHIGIYATPNAHTAFKKELKVYKQGKGSVPFPLDKEMPYDLIRKMLLFNIENTKS